MSRTTSWVRQHRMITFFVLAFVVSWAPWALTAAGIPVGTPFFPGGPLVAALVTIALTDGRRGYRALGSRLIRWRVGWVWYVVALGLPVLLVLVTGFATSWLGAPAPDFSGIIWADVVLLLAFRMVDVTDGAAGEEPGWRGYALPHLQARLSPVSAAALLGVLVAGWHIPLVVLGSLGWIGLPTTVAITFLYVWLFNRTGGSLLMTILFHASQGAFTFGMLGFTGADAERAGYVYFGVVVVTVAAILALDRPAWQRPSGSSPATSRTRDLRRATVVGAAAVVLLTACGGGSNDSDAGSTAAGSTAGTGAAGGDFCAQASRIDDRVDAALADLDEGASVPDALRQTAAELGAIEAPDAIAAEWATLVDGLNRIADAFADLDITDSDALSALEDIEADLTTASADVENYLRDECGIGG
jgi:uncharacterized protein